MLLGILAALGIFVAMGLMRRTYREARGREYTGIRWRGIQWERPKDDEDDEPPKSDDGGEGEPPT